MRSLATVLAFAFLTPTAQAQDALNVTLVPKAQKGQGQPTLVVAVHAPLTSILLKVVRASDQKRFEWKKQGLNEGSTHRFPLPMTKIGADQFEGQLQVDMPNGQSGAMPISVNTEWLAPLEMTIAPNDIDLAARTLVVSATRPLHRVELNITSDRGQPLGARAPTVSAVDPHRRQTIRYDQAPGTPLKISVVGYDADNFFVGIDLYPWRIDIPHEEVRFQSGQHTLDAPEVPKLETSFARIQAAVKKYGAFADIRLFIAGHTDTVGPAETNRTLSLRRAQTIAAWFRKRGVRIPIAYAGLGEDQLLLSTPDDTDEPRNRRAEYIVAVQPPPINVPRWTPLR